MPILQVTEDTFENEVLKADKLVLINFFSPLSAKCAEFTKTLEEFAEKHKDRLKVVSVDVDLCQNLTEAFGVEKIPAVVTMKQDRALLGVLGVMSADMLQRLVEQSLQMLHKHHINIVKLEGPHPPAL